MTGSSGASTQRGGIPAGYQWTYLWPESRRLGTVAVGATMIVVGTLSVSTVGVWLSLAFGLIGVVVIALTRVPSRPSIGIDGGKPVLLNRPWTNPQTYGSGALAAIGFFTVRAQRDGQLPKLYLYGGVALIVIGTAMILMMCINAIGSRMIFEERSLRVVMSIGNRGVDRTFEWDRMSNLAVRRDPNIQNTPIPVVTFNCPHESVMDRSGKPQADNDDSWRITLSAFKVEPNALMATLRILVDSPDARSRLTTEALRAMLTPPPWSQRRRLMKACSSE